mmetsp:Transcript_3897/g.4518  ORF Transcript_3897/g.4518 Transcript_3897/m.4518 type:complete len:481 (-) Transcript_3897:165-1607(-)
MYENNYDNTEPIVVQGFTVPTKAQPSASGYDVGKQDQPNASGEFHKGEIQPKLYKDVGFAIAFLLHLGGIVVVTTLYGSSVNSENEGSNNYMGVAACVGVSGTFSITLSTFALGWMMQFAEQVVKMALMFSIGTSLALGILGLMFGQMMIGLISLASAVCGCCYAYMVWNRIPFAAANLNTALTGVRQNLGLAVVAYIFLAIAFVWSIWWSVAATGTMSVLGEGALFLFFLSFYWTHQVIQNTIHVTSAGVIGTWWFDPSEASSYWSSALTDSFRRATTYSFGSICFGSLLVAVVQALRAINENARSQDECQVLVCLIDCLLGCIQGIIEYLNKWAYIYVGLYGYGYLDAGRNVWTLFQTKGWTTIITDNLIDNVLFMISVVIGLATGIVGLVIAVSNDGIFDGAGVEVGVEDPTVLGFILGFFTGLIMSNILMSVVGSAVNTVIVCFAESPNEFQTNHPKLSDEMRCAWRKAYPEECKY